MKATDSSDEVKRATITIKFRIDSDALVHATATLVAHGVALTKSNVIKELKETLYVSGSGLYGEDFAGEYQDSKYSPSWEELEDWVKDKFPDFF